MRDYPPHVRTVFNALQFLGAQPETLRSLSISAWEDLLSRWDVVRLTVPLRQVCSEYIPDWVRERIDDNLVRNADRFERIKAAYTECIGALRAADSEHLVLKGFAQWPTCVSDPRNRFQSDIDLYCPQSSLDQAREALTAIGYRPELKTGPWRYAGHLPAMARPTKWRWNGDFCDPEMPISVELHFCFWNVEVMCFGPTGLKQFWERRTVRQVDGLTFPALSCPDSLAYTTLNCLRDLLGGTPSNYQVYELAWFLHNSADDEASWKSWRESHDASLRRLAAISFCLAHEWFTCRLPQEVEVEIAGLPRPILHWMERCARPLRSRHLHPNKDGMWLHLRLVESAADRRKILLRRLFPTRPAALQFVDQRSPAWEEPQESPSLPLWSRAKYLAFVASRVAHHGSLLPPTLWRGATLWWSEKGLSRGFWDFFATSCLYSLGMFVFFFLLNLFLLDRGFHDDFLGMVSSANAIGSVAGTVPFGILAHRIGLRKALLLCISIVPLVSAGIAVFGPAPALLALAFTAGAVSTLWEVVMAPAIAQLTNEGNRSFGFSLIFSSGIAVGILGSLAGGVLPGWLTSLQPSMGAIHAKRWALLVGCGLTATAVWPASRLQFAPPPPRGKKFCSGSPFLYHFLVVIALWSLVTGAFSPFYNAYFSEHIHLPVQTIGLVASLSQMTQALAILCAPFAFRRFGLITGIVYTQIAAAISLLALAPVTRAGPAGAIFVSFSAFLWMSQPGIYTLLMSRVAPEEQTGASTLNFLVVSVAQAIATAAAGAAFERFGYPVVMAATGLLGIVAALAFQVLLGASSSESTLPRAGNSPSETPR